MLSALPSIDLKIIGVVKSELEKETRRGTKDLISEIIIDETIADALNGLDNNSHIIVTYLINLAPMGLEPGLLEIHPHRDPKNPLTGILATNAPDRPNAMGLAVVKLVERNGNVLKVKGFSSANGDRVLDIRPYIPQIYCYPDATRRDGINT